MRNPLQNKAIVAGMVVCAILSVGWRVKSYWRPGFLQAIAREPEALVPTAPSIPDSTRFDSQKDWEGWPDYRTNLVDWTSLFPVTARSRDPFAQVDPDWEPVGDGMAGEPFPDTADLVLQAVSIQPSQALVVINQQTLGVGEKIGGFVLERIRAQEVWLKHPQGRHVLSLEFGVTEQAPDVNTTYASP